MEKDFGFHCERSGELCMVLSWGVTSLDLIHILRITVMMKETAVKWEDC